MRRSWPGELVWGLVWQPLVIGNVLPRRGLFHCVDSVLCTLLGNLVAQQYLLLKAAATFPCFHDVY